MKKSIAIVANGSLSEKFCAEIKNANIIIGVDRGAYWLLQHTITPDIAVGDFDSCTKKEFEEIKKRVSDIQTFKADKDFIDTELAVDVALGKKSQEIIIYGGTGTRFDHTMATVSLLERCMRLKISAELRDETNVIQLIGRGRTIIKRREGYRYVSIIPYTKEIVVSLKQLKYPLNYKKIVQGMTLGVSNEFKGSEATVTIHEGLALVIQSKD
jgi:thiamine pyrophosphokinase